MIYKQCNMNEVMLEFGVSNVGKYLLDIKENTHRNKEFYVVWESFYLQHVFYLFVLINVINTLINVENVIGQSI